jgi:hypothetical protein
MGKPQQLSSRPQTPMAGTLPGQSPWAPGQMEKFPVVSGDLPVVIGGQERFPTVSGGQTPSSSFGQGGFFGTSQDFLTGLLSGNLPPAFLAATQRSADLARQQLNSELQKRGAFFSTPGLQMQQDLAERLGTGLNTAIFQNALQAIPQGLGLFGTGAGLAAIPNQLPDWFGGGTSLLNALRGQVTTPMYQPDPLTQILGSVISIIPFL